MSTNTFDIKLTLMTAHSALQPFLADSPNDEVLKKVAQIINNYLIPSDAWLTPPENALKGSNLIVSAFAKELPDNFRAISYDTENITLSASKQPSEEGIQW